MALPDRPIDSLLNNELFSPYKHVEFLLEEMNNEEIVTRLKQLAKLHEYEEGMMWLDELAMKDPAWSVFKNDFLHSARNGRQLIDVRYSTFIEEKKRNNNSNNT